MHGYRIVAALTALCLVSCAPGSGTAAGPRAATPGAVQPAAAPDEDNAAARGGAPRADPPAPAGDEAPAAILSPRAADSLQSVLGAAIRDGVTPGAVVVIGRGEDHHLDARGNQDWADGAPAASDSTVYDLASLTKVLGTTTAVMVLVDRGAMELDAPLSRYLPAWPVGDWRDEVTIRRLLTHRGGLPPFVRFWHPSAGALRGPDAVVRAIATVPPSYGPGTRRVYSDLGFILLGAAVEAVTGQGLDSFLAAEVWWPLGMLETGFNPRPERMAAVRREAGLPTAGHALAPLQRIAPTERDTVFRHTHVHGVVHDENAYAMGGVAGHAGLFSTAADLRRFAAMLRGGGSLEGTVVVRPETLAAFTAARVDGRALGWEARTPDGIGEPFTAAAYGHTGFTGTSLWVDPGLDLFVLLLTNRVNPSRGGRGIMDLRRAVHRLAARTAANTGGDGTAR